MKRNSKLILSLLLLVVSMLIPMSSVFASVNDGTVSGKLTFSAAPAVGDVFVLDARILTTEAARHFEQGSPQAEYFRSTLGFSDSWVPQVPSYSQNTKTSAGTVLWDWRKGFNTAMIMLPDDSEPGSNREVKGSYWQASALNGTIHSYTPIPANDGAYSDYLVALNPTQTANQIGGNKTIKFALTNNNWFITYCSHAAVQSDWKATYQNGSYYWGWPGADASFSNPGYGSGGLGGYTQVDIGGNAFKKVLMQIVEISDSTITIALHQMANGHTAQSGLSMLKFSYDIQQKNYDPIGILLKKKDAGTADDVRPVVL